MKVNDKFDEMLLEVGFDNMSLYDRNQLLVNIGSREKIDHSEITEEYVLDYHKKLKKQQLSDLCNDEIVNGFVASNGNKYRLNRDDQTNFIGKMMQVASDTTITTIHWKTENEGYVEHTREEWLKIFNEGLNHKESILFKYNTLVIELQNATTHSEVTALSWENEIE